MKGVDFPIYTSKREGLEDAFDLNDPKARAKYFEAKVGPQVAKVKKFLEQGSFVAFLLGKKNSGKGTYSKLFMEIMGSEHVGHLSVGDLVRDVHSVIETPAGRAELAAFFEKNHDGYTGFEPIEDSILGRGTTTLLSSEIILTLIKWEVSKRPKQALFIDGFPRAFDQINYALFLKELLGYHDHPDFFVFIDVPENVIDERIKYRVICPICKTPRSTKLLATKEVGYDEHTDTFYLKCDTPACNGERMVAKEGDELGIEPIRERLETDDKIFKQLLETEQMPKIKLRNSVPVTVAAQYVENYELTPAYSYERAGDTVKIIEKPWTIADDNGVESYSLLPAAVVCGLIDQIAEILKL